MNDFIISEIADSTNRQSDLHFPFGRSAVLKRTLALIFSRYLGGLRSGNRFEAEGMIVTGLSGSGKTQEVSHLIKRFNTSSAPLPSGGSARFAECMLEGRISWKDLGIKTLEALGYHVSNRARETQTTIWDRVVFQMKAQGFVGIYYDEAQHIFRGKSDQEQSVILDSFKTLLKSRDWPFMLIVSGVPELTGYVEKEVQLSRLLTPVRFESISMADDLELVHEVVGSFAIENGIRVADDLASEDFYSRLATAAALRWGLLIYLTVNAILSVKEKGASDLTRENFVDAWVGKTNMQRFVNPFTHDSYLSLFRPDNPFKVSMPT